MTSNIKKNPDILYKKFKNRIALLMGSSCVASNAWPDLCYVEGDIKGKNGLSSFLQSGLDVCCFEPKNIHVKLGDIYCREAQVFITEHFLNPDLDENTLIFLYFSGHLTIDKEIGNIPCLVTCDTSIENPCSTGISFSWLCNDILSRTRASVCLVIDTCYSGEIIGFKWPENIAVFTSCSKNEKSFVSSEGDQSHFTKLLMCGLKGKGGDSGIVTTDSLADFLKRESINYGQNPDFNLPEIPMLLSKYRESKAAKRTGPLDTSDFNKWAHDFIKVNNADPLMASSNSPFVHALASHETIVVPKSPYSEQLETGKTSQSVIAFEYLLDWFDKNESSLALVLGDTGLGKSVLLRKVTYKLCSNLEEGKCDRYPLYLNLRMYLDVRLDKPATLPDRTEDEESMRRFRAILIDWLQNEEGIFVSWEEFIQLVESGKLLLVFDGLDEMCRDGKQETVQKCILLLSRLHRGTSRIILSCRTHFFRSKKLMLNLFLNTNFLSNNPEILTLCEFQETEIAHVVQWRLNHEERKQWNQLEKNDVLGITQLSRRPFLLDLLIGHLTEGKKISPSALYKSLLDAWLVRDNWRFSQFMSDFEDQIQRDFHSIQKYISKEEHSQMSFDGIQSILSEHKIIWYEDV